MRRIKHYEIRELLGEGGMGKVYKAYDEALEREVAIKVMSESLTRDRDNVKRFYREARAAASLNHPNVVTIHDVGEEDGACYFVMELLQGESVGDMLKRLSRLAVEETLRIAAQVCRALEVAHTKGLLHRDIKADNVVVLPDGTAKILDFGITRISEGTALTKTGEILGTVEYMAPEQILGENLDERSDIYSLGVLLYKMITGKMPFTGSSPVSIVYQQLEGKPTPPGDLDSSIPLAVENIVLKALSKEPDDRYQSAEGMLKDIESFLDGSRLSREADKEDYELQSILNGMARRDFESKLVGREKELKILKALFDGLERGRGSLVFLSGEAGIGKTRLANEFIDYAERKGTLTLSGVCLYNEAAEPYLPFIDAIAQYFEVAKEDGRRERIKDFIREEIPELKEFTSRFKTPIGFERSKLGHIGTSKEQLFKAISQLLILLAEEAPLVLLLDDVHWADSASLQLLHYTARNISSRPLMIIATFRPEELFPSEGQKVHPLKETLQRMSREGLYEEIELEGLSKDDLGAMIESLFKKAIFSPDFRDSLHQETGGNPFFTIEVLKLLRDSGVIFEKNGVWREAREITRADIPTRVYDVIARRIERLDEDQRDMLQLAAVEGETFTSDALVTLLGLGKIQLLKAIDRLGRVHQIIHPQGDGYAFSHTKIREVLYDEMPEELRREYHLALGEYLEEKHAENPNRIAVRLANHFYQGGDFDKAVPYLTQAAERAERLFAYRESCRCYEQVLKSLKEARSIEDKDSLRKDLALQAGRSYSKLGEWNEALAKFEVSTGLSEKAGDLGSRAEALIQTGWVYYKKNEFDTSLRYYQESLEDFERIDDLRGQCKVLNNIGIIHHERSEWDQVTACYQRALQIARQIEDKEEIANIYTNLGIISNMRGRLDEAMSYYQSCIPMYKDIKDWRGLARVFHNMGMLYADKKDWHNARKSYEKCLQISNKIRDISLTALTYLNRTEILIALSDLKEAKISCVKALEIFKELDDSLAIADAFRMLGMVSTQEGDWEGASSCFQESIELNQKFQHPLGLAEAYREYGVMLKEKGETEDALAKLEMARSLFEEVGAEEDLKDAKRLICELEAHSRPMKQTAL